MTAERLLWGVGVSVAAIAVAAWFAEHERRVEARQAEIASATARATAADDDLRAEAKRLLGKTTAELGGEARAADARQAAATAEDERQHARRAAGLMIVERCRNAIHEKWPYLEAVDAGPTADDGSVITVRFTVRPHDSFRAAPIGVVECADTMEGRSIGPSLAKVPQ